MAIAIDALLIAAAIFMIARGAKRGLILSLCGFLAVVLALIGAKYAVDHFAPPVAARLSVSIEESVAEKLSEMDYSALPEREAVEQAIPEIIRGYGFYEKTVDRLFELVQKALDGLSEELVPAAAAATAKLISESIAKIVVFLLSFVLVLLACWGAAKLLNLVFQLPLLKECNALGGAIFGAAKALVLLILLGVVIRYSGALVPQSLVEQTYVLRFFANLF